MPGHPASPSAAAPPLAIVSALHEELRALLPLVIGARTVSIAGRNFVCGEMHARPVVLALSGIGKVAAATTATLLLQAFDAHALIFTGVAGGLGRGVKVGDVVVARQLVQHDMDVSPLFPRYVVPSSGRSHFDVDAVLADGLAAAAARFLARADDRPGAGPPRLHQGLVVSGDRFVSSHAQSEALRAALPQALAVEMEGAAVAQACSEFGRPFAVLRTVSDRADDAAHVDFKRFIEDVASVYTREIVGDWWRHAASA